MACEVCCIVINLNLQKRFAESTLSGVKSRAKKAVPRRDRTKSVSLLVIDSAPIRKKARSDYDRVLRQLNLARGDLERFEAQDRPAYLRWLHRHFGPALTELREAHHQLLTKRALLFEIESEAFCCGISLVEAYRQMMRRTEKARGGGNSERTGTGEENGSGDDAGAGGPDPDDPFDPFRAGTDHQQDSQQWSRSGFEAREIERNRTRRIKELYRALARRLHPDSHKGTNEQKLEWWHQARAAYESNDVDQLEMILTLCDLAERGAAAETSVSLLKRVTAQLRSSLRSLKRQLVRCKGDPAWEFSRRSDLKRLASQMQEMLAGELSQLKSVLKTYETQIERIASAAARVRRRSRGRSASDCEFF